MIGHSSAMKCGAALAFALAALSSPASAAPGDKVKIGGLVDAAFGTLNTASDQSVSQNVCAFSNSATSGYSVTASGDGTAGAFTLAAGSFSLPYEVQWSGSTNQTTGTSLDSGSTASGFISSATNNGCNSGPAASATLIVIVRASALGSARAGSYSGTLSITLAPE